MSERSSAIFSKIERANKHITDFDRLVGSFFDSNPYTFSAKRNPDTGEWVYYLVSAAAIPHPLALTAGDAIQNLRSALDHLVCGMVEANGCSVTGNNEFPICSDSAYYKANAPRKVKGIRPEAEKAIDAIEPYKGGRGHELWVLHKLNNIHKHRMLVTVGAATHGMNIFQYVGWQAEQALGRKIPPLPPGIFGHIIDAKNSGKSIFPIKAGTKLLVAPPSPEPNKKMEFAFHVAFCESGVCEGEPVIKTLHGMANLVQNIVSDFNSFL